MVRSHCARSVVRQRGSEPGSSLLQNHLVDVEIVWIGGQLHYGTASVVDGLRPGVCNSVIVQGAAKRLCVPVLPLVAAFGKPFPYLVPCRTVTVLVQDGK